MSDYHIESGIWQSVFAVPTEIVDKHLKLCGAVSLKVLLILLRHGGNIDDTQLARMLGHSVGDIRDALAYWVHLGVITVDNAETGDASVLVYSEVAELNNTDTESPPKNIEQTDAQSGRINKMSRSRRRLSTQDINEIARGDKSVGELLQETQALLGKELTPIATDTVVALYSYYGMKPDIILMLIHYCVSLGKSSMNYVEKVAASWIEQGIDSHERAEEEIMRATSRRQNEGRIKTMFGIYDRALVAKEENFIAIWVDKYKFDDSLIRLAFERTVETKGKLSFDYINGILTNWYNKGIKTPAQAMQEITRGPSSGAKKESGGKKEKEKDASYNMAELEDMITYSNIAD